jgi:hypothetical protein
MPTKDESEVVDPATHSRDYVPPPTPPAAPDEDWTADPERDRKATVRDRPAPRRR